jgi:hypothetical protein
LAEFFFKCKCSPLLRDGLLQQAAGGQGVSFRLRLLREDECMIGTCRRLTLDVLEVIREFQGAVVPGQRGLQIASLKFHIAQ